MARQSPPVLAARSALALVAGLLSSGCIGQRIIQPVMPSPELLAEFEAAGPADVQVDTERLVAMNAGGGDYRVVAGDLLELELPPEITGGDAGAEDSGKVRSRVSRDGNVQLPLLGDVAVAGRSTSGIEELVAAAYHPEVVAERPNVVVEVVEHRTWTVAVMGAVINPGIHPLRSDRLSLLGALMAAGGINEERGAGMIRIVEPSGEGGDPILLPVRDSTIPLSDVALTGGETVVVEPLQEQQFTVIGLVKRPGAYKYPYYRSYNLMQALAVAGGTDETAAPRYATIYRKKQDGEVLGCTFKIDGVSLTDSSNVLVKPGDVVSVDHTQGSWLRLFLAQILGFRLSIASTSSSTL